MYFYTPFFYLETLLEVPGVISCNVSLENEEANVTYKSQEITTEQIAKVMRDMNYTVSYSSIEDEKAQTHSTNGIRQ